MSARRVGLAVLAMLGAMALTASLGAAAELRLKTNPEDGRPAQMIWEAGPLGGALAQPVAVQVVRWNDGKAFPLSFTRDGGASRARVEEMGLVVGVEWRGGDPAQAVFDLRNEGKDAQTFLVQVNLALRPSCDRAFFPANDCQHLDLVPGASAKAYGYIPFGAEIKNGMPLGTLYDRKGDWGLAAFTDFTAPVPPTGLHVRRDQQAAWLEVHFNHITLAPEQSARRSLYLAGIRGDWRPALKAVRHMYPEVFTPTPGKEEIYGPFYSGGVANRNDAYWEKMKRFGLRNFEVHVNGTGPFYGRYVPLPEDEPFTPVYSDHHIHLMARGKKGPPRDASMPAIRDFVHQEMPPTVTREKVREGIDRLRKHGVTALLYWNHTQCWRPFALKEFPQDVVYVNDQPRPTWRNDVVMRSALGRKWTTYILEQGRKLLETYPNADGFFIDMAGEGPHSNTQVLTALKKILVAKKPNGIFWMNGPHNIELAALADGMMVEGNQKHGLLPYYGIGGKPITAIVGPHTDAALKRALVNGLTMDLSIAKSNPQSWEAIARWKTLYDDTHRRRWVLDAHAIETDDRVEANLFEIPGGNYVAPIIARGDNSGPTDFDCGVDVTFRLSSGDSVRAVYWRCPELAGLRKLAFVREPGVIRVRVPRVKTAGVLTLATNGTYVALDDYPVLIPGHETTVRAVLDNWTDTPWKGTFGLEAATERVGSVVVAAGGSRSAKATVRLPADSDSPRHAVKIVAVGEAVDLSRQVDLWVERPPLFRVAAPDEMRDNETAKVTVTLVSREARTVTVTPASDGIAFAPNRAAVTLEPGEMRQVRFDMKPRRAGRFTKIGVLAEAPGWAHKAERRINVIATAIRPEALKAAQRAEIVFDASNVTWGKQEPYLYRGKHVALNGTEIGVLPGPGRTIYTSGGNWFHDARMPIPFGALKALRQTNVIEIHNKESNHYKVGNFRIALYLRGGIIAVSETDRNVYTWPGNWRYAEGKRFWKRHIKGITVPFRMDASRTEVYENPFGNPVRGELLMEVRGRKSEKTAGVEQVESEVILNDLKIGVVPPTPDEWTPVALPLTAEAAARVLTHNHLIIAAHPAVLGRRSSDKQYAAPYSMRNIRLSIVNAAGEQHESAPRANVTQGNPIVHTSNRYRVKPIEMELVIGQGSTRRATPAPIFRP